MLNCGVTRDAPVARSRIAHRRLPDQATTTFSISRGITQPIVDHAQVELWFSSCMPAGVNWLVSASAWVT